MVSHRLAHVAKLRVFVVISYVFLSTTSIIAAFALSWCERAGAPWFLGTGAFLGLWASVTATCQRVAAEDILHVAKAIAQKNGPIQRDAP